MDVLDAINILREYHMYEQAEAECNRRKISESPYDMQGHHKVYCEYLSKKWVEKRNKKDELQKVKCKQWDNIPQNEKLLHDDCCFCQISINNYCKMNCNFYSKEILPLENEMSRLAEAEKVLKDAAQKDYYLR